MIPYYTCLHDWNADKISYYLASYHMRVIESVKIKNLMVNDIILSHIFNIQ